MSEIGEMALEDIKEYGSLSKYEKTAIAVILQQTARKAGATKKEIMRILQIRTDEAFELFIKKVNSLMGDLLRIVYDDEQQRCIAMTRLVQSTARYVLNEFDLALLLYIFYCERVAGQPFVRFESILRQFEQVDLHAERKLKRHLTKLVQEELLRLSEEGGQDEETSYCLTAIGRCIFPEYYLKRVLSVSQGGDVSLEQVRDFFKLGTVDDQNRVDLEDNLQQLDLWSGGEN
ncbi:hypothetical protein K0T92_16270 [Paenibacillus oenotherae]|uniref:Uncharacterized protein n=1 Tax=Paenibacillus oenotherae TaxID=1435645 RepID=A0ABS7D932_9BACL|nr:hypothetical protein [Paenibacillus oenotherae]MBW7476289.1 hypothetical protein [Paenibacillus oenotherae]